MNTNTEQRGRGVWDDEPAANFTDVEVAQVLSSSVAPADDPSIFTEDLNEFDAAAVSDNESVGNSAVAVCDLSGRFLLDRIAVPTGDTPETITLARIDHRYYDSDVWWVTLHSTDGREFTFDPGVTVIALAPGAAVQSATRRYDKSSVSRIGA